MILLASEALKKLEIVKERGEPACGRAANYGGLFSPPQAAKNVRANLRIVHYMKSPEQIGEKPEQPEEELSQFAQDVIARETENQNYGFVYRFRKNMGIGTEEEVKAAGEQAYKFFLEVGDSGSVMSIAEDMYGKDSDEWRRANEANEAKWRKTEEKRKEEKMEDEGRELNAIISKDATFTDLFSAIDAIEEKEVFDAFEEDLWDNFDFRIVEEVLAFRDAQANKAATTKILDFFKERGYSQSDVSALLPIKFRRERKKK